MKLVCEPLEMTVVRWLMGGCVLEKFKLVEERLLSRDLRGLFNLFCLGDFDVVVSTIEQLMNEKRHLCIGQLLLLSN